MDVHLQTGRLQRQSGVRGRVVDGRCELRARARCFAAPGLCRLAAHPRPAPPPPPHTKQVTLVDDRVIMGDFQCLDKQGNLILGNAHEVISHHAASSGSTTSSTTSSSGGPAAACNGGNGGGNGGGGAPMERTLGVVLVPREQQKDVQLLVTLSERAAMLQLAGS
jgi:hypothetical protein